MKLAADRNDAIAIVTETELADLIEKVAAGRAVSMIAMIVAVAAAEAVAVVAGIEIDRATVTVVAVDKNVAQGEVIDAFKL